MLQIERDYGGGNVQLAYRYGYSSDGVRVWKQDVLNGQEYRYVCRIGCGGVPMRVYSRDLNGGSWVSVEDYLSTFSSTAYSNLHGDFTDYSFPAGGNMLFDLGGLRHHKMIVRDANGHTPRAYTLDFPPPLYLLEVSDFSTSVPAWVVAIIWVVVHIVSCIDIANKIKEEVFNWPHNHSGNPNGGDKLVHCVAACLIGLHPKGGIDCALAAALSTERKVPWEPPAPGSEGALDEKANFDGVDCALRIGRIRNRGGAGVGAVSDNDWLECQWCCHQKGYRRWH